MSATYTPGPWRVYSEKDFHPGIEAKRATIVIWGEEGEEAGVRGKSHEERLANARLIASAPDLLEFAELVLRGIESGHIKAKPFLDTNALVGDSIPMRTIGGAAREVIAKATGESQ